MAAEEEIRIEKVCFLVNNAVDVLRAEGWSFTGDAWLTPDGETHADSSEAAEYAHRVWLAGVKAEQALVLMWPRWRLWAISGYHPECEIIIRGRTEAEAMARLCDLMAWGEGLPVGAIFERVEGEGEGE